jgi:hypothetical protein
MATPTECPAPAPQTESRTRRKALPAAQDAHRTNLPGEDRRRLIAEAAYFRAERRGFVRGCELEDWLAAEIEIDALLGEGDRQ